MASTTGLPSPSSTRPSMRNAPSVPGGTSSLPCWPGRAKLKKGPMVWEGVGRYIASALHWGRVAAAQHDVEPGHQERSTARVGDGLVDGVVRQQQVAGEVHLRDQAGGKGGAEE